jgi:branched-chain amino acid transport system substrate-binding protein
MRLSRRNVIKNGSAAALLAAGGRSVFAQGQTIQIGFPYELSGKFVAYGAAGKRGSEMALEAFDYKAGKFAIEPLWRDVQSDPQATVSAMTELVVNKKLNYVVGPIGSPIVAACISVVKQGQPLWFVPGSTSTTLEDEIGKANYFFHTFPYAYEYHVSEAAALKIALGGKGRIAVVYSDDAYGRTHLPYVEKYYPAAGFEIVAKELVRANSTDLNPALTKISREKPDILIGLVQTTDAITLTKQIHTRRLKVPVLVGTAYTQLAEWQNAVGDAQENWIGVTTYLPGMDRPASKEYPQIFPKLSEWVERFKKRYNLDADFLDVANYATTALLIIAIEKAGVDDKTKVADELRKLDTQTINGRGQYVPSAAGITQQQAFTDMVVFQRQQGKNVVLYPADAANGQLVTSKA